jgi:formate dehydrogenase major subunit
MPIVRININGEQIKTTEDKNILQAALENNIEIPHLCFDERMEAYGGCGLCVVEVEGMPKLARACATPVKEGMIITTNTDRTTAARKTALSLLVSDHRGDCRPPCMMACPAHTDVQGYSGLIANGQYKEAVKLIKEDLPIPASIGRVCPHPCETDCRRNHVDKPVSIATLKAFAADYDLFDPREETYMPDIQEKSGKKIAIVGAGPAGLSAAYFLAKNGHEVKVYEAMDKPGGMMRYGIPQYRLPKHIIDAEVKLIENMGVQFKYNTKIGEDITVKYLENHYDATFMAIGAWESSSMRCEGEKAEGVIGGIDFLRKVTQNEKLKIGNKVIVVGGGNTAMDVARTCVRLGAKEVTVVYRRTEEEMPAEKIEIKEAKEEGVKFNFLYAPIKVTETEGKATGLLCQKMKLGEADESGRRKPEPIEGQTETIESDTIIAAIGQNVTMGGIKEIKTSKWGTIEVNEETFQTNIKGIFAGGDAVRGPQIAIQAVADGKNAAKTIEGYLRGQEIKHKEPIIIKQKDLTEKDFIMYEKKERVAVKHLQPEIRKANFEEIVTYHTEEEAQKEGSRCLECGCKDYFECQLIKYVGEDEIDTDKESGANHNRYQEQTNEYIDRNPDKCIQCGLCVRTCDEFMGITALGLVDRGFDATIAPEFNRTLEETDCIFCGQCIDVCPVGAIQEKIRTHKEIPLNLEKQEAVCGSCSLGCNITYQYEGKKIYKVTPDRTKDDGVLCKKGKFEFDYVNKEGRIITPIIKSEGERKVICFQEAGLDFVSKLKSIKYLNGKDSIGFLVSQKLTNEELKAIKEIAKELETEMTGSINIKEKEIQSTTKFDELHNAELIISIGNVYESFTPIGVKIKNLKKPSISISTEGTRLDKFSEASYQKKDMAFFLKAVIKELIANNTSLSKASNYEALKEKVADIAVEEDAKSFAAKYTKTAKAIFVIDELTVNSEVQSLILEMAILTGKIEKPHRGIITLKKEANAQGAINAGFNKTGDEILAKVKEGKIKALVTIGEDIKDLDSLNLEYLVNMNMFKADASNKANLLLPLASIVESEGTLTRTDGVTQNTYSALKPVSGKTNLEIFKDILKVLVPQA